MTDAIRFAVDTNILIYAGGYNDAARGDAAAAMLAGLGHAKIVLPTQVVGEFYTVLTRRTELGRAVARVRTEQVAARFAMHAAMPDVFLDALALASAHQFQLWDALILATAADARCQLLLSEDMADGFVWRGCTVANPFVDRLHPLLADALRER